MVFNLKMIREIASKIVMFSFQYLGSKFHLRIYDEIYMAKIVQWNLSVTTTFMITFIACDLFSNVFQWRLKVPIYSRQPFLPSGAHLGGPWPPRWAPESREVSH